MNGLIKLLMVESGAYDYYEINEGFNDDEGPMVKFAESIVNEILLKVNGAKIRNESYEELIANIRKDFGV